MIRTPVDSASLGSDGYGSITKTLSRLYAAYRIIVLIPGCYIGSLRSG